MGPQTWVNTHTAYTSTFTHTSPIQNQQKHHGAVFQINSVHWKWQATIDNGYSCCCKGEYAVHSPSMVMIAINDFIHCETLIPHKLLYFVKKYNDQFITRYNLGNKHHPHTHHNYDIFHCFNSVDKIPRNVFNMLCLHAIGLNTLTFEQYTACDFTMFFLTCHKVCKMFLFMVMVFYVLKIIKDRSVHIANSRIVTAHPECAGQRRHCRESKRWIRTRSLNKTSILLFRIH